MADLSILDYESLSNIKTDKLDDLADAQDVIAYDGYVYLAGLGTLNVYKHGPAGTTSHIHTNPANTDTNFYPIPYSNKYPTAHIYSDTKVNYTNTGSHKHSGTGQHATFRL